MKLMDYECKTTFWTDFSIADHFGIKAVKDTYRRAFREWKDNTEYLTELVMVLNHKIWQWYERNEILARVYNDPWEKTHIYAVNALTGEDLDHYFRITD